MLNFFLSLFLSIMLSFGISIALVEKGKDFPIKPWRIRLQLFLRKIHRKLPKMLKCTTCTSFWVSGFSDLILCLLNLIFFGSFYFFWPFSGFCTIAVVWTVIEYLNSLDKKPPIFIENIINKE